MLDDIESEKDGISFVLVFKLSRFGRNAADVLKSMQLHTDCEVDLVYVCKRRKEWREFDKKGYTAAVCLSDAPETGMKQIDKK